MQSNWWLSVLTGLEIAALASVCFLLIQRRMLREWRFLFISVATELVVRLVLEAMVLYSHGKPVKVTAHHYLYYYYFYFYWYSKGVMALLRFGVILDVLRSFSGLDFLPWKLHLLVGSAGLTMAVASGIWCFLHDPPHGAAAEDWAVTLNACVFVAWGMLILTMLLPIKAFNFAWSGIGARLGDGAFLLVIAGIVSAYLYTKKDITARLWANGIDGASLVSICVYWSSTLSACKSTASYLDSH